MKSLVIQNELGYRSGAANCHGNLGYVYHHVQLANLKRLQTAEKSQWPSAETSVTEMQ